MLFSPKDIAPQDNTFTKTGERPKIMNTPHRRLLVLAVLLEAGIFFSASLELGLEYSAAVVVADHHGAFHNHHGLRHLRLINTHIQRLKKVRRSARRIQRKSSRYGGNVEGLINDFFALPLRSRAD